MLTLLWLTACAPITPATSAPLVQEAAPMAAVLDRLWAWLPGEYSNHEQAVEDIANDVQPPHTELHHLFLPVRVPALGERVLYVRQRAAGSDQPYRVRLYTLRAQTDHVRMDIWKFSDEAAWRDAHLQPGTLAALNQGDLVPTPGCEISWTPDGDGITGRTGDATCRIDSDRYGGPIVISDTLHLTEETLSIHDVATTPDGAPVFGDPDSPPHLNRKLRYYDGWAVVRPGGHQAPAEDGWRVHKPLRLHNEGDTAHLVDADGVPMGYHLELARLTRSRSNTQLLKLAIVDTDTGKTLRYAWTDPKAGRLGLNLGWMQVGLTADTRVPHFERDPARASPADKLATYLTGTFDSSAQAAAEASYHDIRLTACPVTAPDIGERVLYVEQAASAKAETPYRQRLYHITDDGPAEVRSTIYTLTAPEEAVGLCGRDTPAAFSRAQVTERTGCDVHLTLKGDAFVGGTRGAGCASSRSGATFATVEVTVHPDALESWDRGWAAEGEQAWGAEDGPYTFARVHSD